MALEGNNASISQTMSENRLNDVFLVLFIDFDILMHFQATNTFKKHPKAEVATLSHGHFYKNLNFLLFLYRNLNCLLLIPNLTVQKLVQN